MYVLLKDDLVIESSHSPIVAATDGDYFVSQTRHHYDPRPSSGVVVVEMEFPEESFCEYRIINGTPVLINASLPLADRQSAAWERIKAERDRRKSLGVKVGAHWYHSDADSRIQQLSLFVMGAAVPPVQWKTLTLSPPPVFVTMTPAIAAGIFQGTAASDAAIFAAAETHRVAIEASSTPESYDMSSGWPASIEGEAL